MNFRLIAFLLLISAATASGQTLKDERLFGEWVIDVKQTEAYLRSNRIMSEKALEKMRPILTDMHLKFEEKKGWKIGKTPEENIESSYTVLAVTDKKTVLSLLDASGQKVTMTLTWDGDGYWQESAVFPRYRERFKRLASDRNQNQASDAKSSKAEPAVK